MRRVKYRKHPAKVPVKGAQTYCTCDCHILSKVTLAATLTSLFSLANIFRGKTSACGLWNAKYASLFPRIEKCSYFYVQWKRVFCLPLNGESLFEEGRVLFYTILFGALVRWEWKPLNSLSWGKRGMWALLPSPACMSPQHLYAEGAWVCEESSTTEKGHSMEPTGSPVLPHA